MFKDMVEYGIYYVDRYEICFDCMVGAQHTALLSA